MLTFLFQLENLAQMPRLLTNTNFVQQQNLFSLLYKIVHMPLENQPNQNVVVRLNFFTTFLQIYPQQNTKSVR